MKEDNREQGKAVVHPAQHSIEDLLRHVDHVPDEETERFVTAIYDDRRKSAE